jgi:hypothetical protein
MSTSQFMTAFDLLRFRSLVALVTYIGALLRSKIAGLWARLWPVRDMAAKPNGHPWSGAIIPVGQPQGLVRLASWLSYRPSGDSLWRTALWLSTGIPGRWPLATAFVSPAKLRGPITDGGRIWPATLILALIARTLLGVVGERLDAAPW